MIRIAHRGNTTGPIPEKENHPIYLMNAVESGFDCEIDVWYIDGKILLGHDNPQYTVDIDFIRQDYFWCHAKNLAALELMLNENVHCFWHEHDQRTLTSKGYIWTYPGKECVSEKSIICIQKPNIPAPVNCLGICTDWVYEHNEL
jgi:hypothetical protein